MSLRFEPIQPVMQGQKLWAARSGNYSFIISLEEEVLEPEWAGYMASWKNVGDDMKPFGKQPANLIDGGPWQRFSDVERVCRQTLKQLRMQQ
jgi:hypothetical protein